MFTIYDGGTPLMKNSMTTYEKTLKELNGIVKGLSFENLYRLLACARGLDKSQTTHKQHTNEGEKPDISGNAT